MNNQCSIIERLLQRKANVDAVDNKGFTPVHAAVANDSVKATIALVEVFQARIDVTDENGGNILEMRQHHEGKAKNKAEMYIMQYQRKIAKQCLLVIGYFGMQLHSTITELIVDYVA